MAVIARINTAASPLLSGAEAYCRESDGFVRDAPTVYQSAAVAMAEIHMRGLKDVSVWHDEFLESFVDEGDIVTFDDLNLAGS